MGARVTTALVSLALCLTVGGAPAAAFEDPSRERDRFLPGCGICYPGGYDLDTVGSVRGTVTGLRFPDEGPVRIALETDRERWVVLASPVRHWKTQGMTLGPGSPVTVRGSKTLGSDGTLYLVAQELRMEGTAVAVVLRDDQGRPLWGGARRGGNRGAGRWRGNGACRP